MNKKWVILKYMKEIIEYFVKYVNYLKEKDLYPHISVIDGPSSSPEILINNKKFLTFCSNNYLGLADNAEIKNIVADHIKKYGVGSGSTRMLSGTLDIQVKLEKELVKFFNFEDSITFSSGFLANVGVIRMLVDTFPYFSLFKEKKGLIISDELNHASIIDGVRLSKADRDIYKHNDIDHLEKILKKNRNKRKLIVTDGIFSMDGDFSKIKEISELAKEYDTLFMVDDSHGVGVLGPEGKGTSHALGAGENVDVIMGSFTKAFGSIGGFVAVNKQIGEYLRITARSFIFSDPIIPSVVAGLIRAIEIIKNGDDLRRAVLKNAFQLRNGLEKLGFTVLGEETPIIPLLIGSEEKAIKFADMLYNNNSILAPCIRRPAVIEGKERIRFSVMANHKEEQINILLGACEKIGKSLELI